MTDPDPKLHPIMGKVATTAAVGLIIVFVGMIFLLMQMRADRNWDRLMYLLGGLEAVVFAGAGALFGTTVQRGMLMAARQDAAAAQAQAAKERGRADAMQHEAAAGRMLATAVKAKESRPQPHLGEETRAGWPEPIHPDLAELASMASMLFPDNCGPTGGEPGTAGITPVDPHRPAPGPDPRHALSFLLRKCVRVPVGPQKRANGTDADSQGAISFSWYRGLR
jgi:hypothetical protein